MLGNLRTFAKVGKHNLGRVAAVCPQRTGISTSTAQYNVAADAADTEPNFLEMVSIYADNAHAIALDKLLAAQPAPGKRQEESSVREKHIRGKYDKVSISSISSPSSSFGSELCPFSVHSLFTGRHR